VAGDNVADDAAVTSLQVDRRLFSEDDMSRNEGEGIHHRDDSDEPKSLLVTRFLG